MPGQWSKVNTSETIWERLGLGERVVRNTSIDRELEEMGINPNRPEKLTRKQARAMEKILRDAPKEPRKKR